MMMDEFIDSIREKDQEIMKLIAERTEIAKELGKWKMSQNAESCNGDHNSEVIDLYSKTASEEGLDPAIATKIAEALIEQAANSNSSLVKSPAPRKIAIIGGAGKMGKWTGDMLSRSGHYIKIIDPASKNGLTVNDCADADIVVVSVPIHATETVLRQLDGICKPDALIFDLTSLKSPIVPILKELATRRKVCSIHPMFGPSAASMFGRNLVVCDCGNKQATEEATSLFDERGGNIRVMDVEEHDVYMSYVLGLSHAINIAFFTVLDRSGISYRDMESVASTTFRKNLDTNASVALEDPQLYYEIQHMNEHRDEMWNLFSNAVNDLKEASLNTDPSSFVQLMENGRKYFSENNEQKQN